MADTIEVTALIPVESQEKLKGAMRFLAGMQELNIGNQKDHDHANNLLKDVKRVINGIEEDRINLVKPYKEKATAIDAHYRGVRVVLENAEKTIKRGMAAWKAEDDRKRLELQRKLEAEAEEKRRKAEAKADEERRKAEEYAAQGREDMAAKAEARAQSAEMIAETIVAPIVEAPKTEGLSYRTDYDIEVIDEAKAMQFCLSNSIMRTYLTLDVKGLERLARAQKGRLVVDGIRVIEKKTPVSRL